MNTGKNYAKEAGTWTGIGVLLAETVGFHPLGMVIGTAVAVGSRYLTRDKKTSWK